MREAIPGWTTRSGLGGTACLLVAASLAAAPTDVPRPWWIAPPARPEVPGGPASAARHPIDAFLARSMSVDGLTPAPEADRRTLIRRVTFDLIGLPPTPAEVAAFLADPRPDAYEILVDRLLASPHHGERWARHWLDLVRFAETHGYERDAPKPHAWKYRDWVVAALNRDLPYDRFLVEQLAGDEVPDATPSTRTATGLLRLIPIDDEPADKLADRFDQLDEMIETVGTSMLGLTIHCARCHDHKFDPISQADYYRLLAFFSPSKPFVRDDESSITLAVPTPEEAERLAAANADVTAKINTSNGRIEAIRAYRKLLLAAGSARTLDLGQLVALVTPSGLRDARRRNLAARALKALRPDAEAIQDRLTDTEKAEIKAIKKSIKALDEGRPKPPAALGLTDADPAADPTRILIRGDAHTPGPEVTPGFPAILDPNSPAIVPPADGRTTGRRLALARWIARGDHPLTARVMVNRLWQQHFGVGLVPTPSDFGVMGEPPTDPALLDWLAAEFVSRGWSLKAMHRLMVTSAAYRRSGRWDDFSAEADPGNARLWRRAPRRLEAEAIRDAALAVSGALNPTIGGPSVTPPIDANVLAGQSRPGNGWGPSDDRSAARRSIYVRVKRTLALPELEVLDAPDASDPCPRRAVTTTAPQALTLLNSAFLHDQAGRFADRLVSEAGPDPSAQVRAGFDLAFGRPPTEDEAARSLGFLADQAGRIGHRPGKADPSSEALKAFCLVLLNANEFVTVD